MATTASGSPYVESSDLVANYPAVSEAIAERVDTVGVLPFASSTARGTALPSPTEGQYTYLQDTNVTEYWDGSAWVAASVVPGLVHINTTTFSAVSSVSIDNVFTSDYESYMVSLAAAGSTDVLIRWRLRLAGTDATTSAYTQAYLNPGNGVATDNNGFFIYPSTSFGSGQLHLYNPQAASVTAANVAGGNFGQLIFAAIRHNVATAYDGITIYMPSGTMTGTARVYGYKNA